MWFFSLLVLCILHLIHCQSYDDLANDECFKKIYVCGDLRSRVSGEDGKLITNAREFVGRCKANKEFMACIDDAAIFCKGMLNDFSEMVLKNRMGLKLICSEPEWGQKYLNYAQCINENEPRLLAECRTEDALKPDDRPWWCLIPEPCDAIERVFICTYQKIENTCGKHSGEIYRMIQVLKLRNQDVVCEFRRRNPTYCKYNRKTSTRPKRDLSKEKYGSPMVDFSTLETIQTAVSEAVQNVAKAITINLVESVVKNVESSTVKHKDEKCINKTLASFFKEISLLKDNVIADRDYQKLINIDDIHCESTKSLSKDSSLEVSLEKFLKLACLSGKITDHCFSLAKKAWKMAKDETQQIKEMSISKHMKDALLRMGEQLEKQDIVIDKIYEQVTIYFENMGSIPIKEFQCSMVSNVILKCSLDVESSSGENEEGSGSSKVNTESEKLSYEEVLLVDSFEPGTEYFGDILTETTLDSVEKSTADESSDSSDSSLEADDRTGDIFIPDNLGLESETAVTLEPEETLELTEANDKSVSLGTTEYSNLNTDKRYIILGKPTLSSNKYILVGGPYLPRDPTDQPEAEREETMTEVYVVSTENFLDEKVGSFVDVSGTVDLSYNPVLESSTISGTGATVEKDEKKEREKLEVFLADVDEHSNALRKESPELETSKNKIKRKENEEVTIDSVASYQTEDLNGLASGYSSTFENLDELLQSIKFEVTEEPSKADSVEAQAFNTETEFLTTSYPTESTIVHKLEL